MSYPMMRARVWLHKHPLKNEVTDEDVARGYAAPIDENGFYLVTRDFNVWSNKTHKFLRGAFSRGVTTSWGYNLSGVGHIGILSAYEAACEAFPKFAAFEFPEEYWKMNCLPRALEIFNGIKI